MTAPAFTVQADGSLRYSLASVRAALGVGQLGLTPHGFEDKAMAWRASDPVHAATLYLAAGLVSLSPSRTRAYEAAAADLMRRPMLALERFAGKSALPLLSLADVEAVAAELDKSALEVLTLAQSVAVHLDDGERVLAHLCELKAQVLGLDEMPGWEDGPDFVEFPGGEFPPQGNVGPLR